MDTGPHHLDASAGAPGREALEAGIAAFVHQDNETAQTQLRAAIAADPDIAEAHYMLGLTLLRLDRQDEAITALQHTAAHSSNVLLRDYATNKLADLGLAERVAILQRSGARPASPLHVDAPAA